MHHVWQTNDLKHSLKRACEKSLLKKWAKSNPLSATVALIEKHSKSIDWSTDYFTVNFAVL